MQTPSSFHVATEGEPTAEALLTEVRHGDQLFAVILRAAFRKPGTNFLTPGSLDQQLAYLQHPKGADIVPHFHNPVVRKITSTQEALIIRKGRLRVDFYADDRKYLFSYELSAGDVILMVAGGHGFQMLEDIEMIEIKQGPFVGNSDKARFSPPDASTVTIRK